MSAVFARLVDILAVVPVVLAHGPDPAAQAVLADVEGHVARQEDVLVLDGGTVEASDEAVGHHVVVGHVAVHPRGARVQVHPVQPRHLPEVVLGQGDAVVQVLADLVDACGALDLDQLPLGGADGTLLSRPDADQSSGGLKRLLEALDAPPAR